MHSFSAIQLLLLIKLINSSARADDDYAVSIYNSINVSIELVIAVILSGSFISWASVSTLKANTVSMLALIMAMIALVLVGSSLNGVDLFAAASNLMRTALPLTYLIFLHELTSRQPMAAESLCIANKIMAVALAILAFYGILFFPNIINRGEIWWPAYFGGLHPSAYILLAGFFCFYSAYIFKPGKNLRLLLAAYFLCCFTLLFFGWGVRTVLLCALVFSYCMVCFRFKLNPATWLFGTITFFVATLILLVSTGAVNFADLASLTSGRLIMYMEKAEQLSSNGLTGWMLGNGYGSDMTISKTWWWEEKGSHNDYISLLVENGILFVCVFGYFLTKVYKNITITNYQKSLFLAILCTSLVSNGYLVRPHAFYILINALILFGASTAARPSESTNI
jgi:hypothetical protein